MKLTSLTLARFQPCAYQVTYWNDGIARWDASEGQRSGSWQAVIPIDWFRRAAAIAKSLRSSKRILEPDVSVLVTSPNREVRHAAKQGYETDRLWVVATLLDGMASRAQWAPLDTTGELDMAPWAAGIRMNLVKGSCAAQALARPEGIVVLAGSQLATSTEAALERAYESQRSSLLADGSLQLWNERFVLTRHLFFRTPSAAASVVSGSNTNGRQAWRDESGRPWSDLWLGS